MKFLKQRRNAVIISIAAAIGATLFGVGRSLASEAAKVEAMFYNGVYLQDQRYTQPGINTHLNNRLQNARLFVTIASNYNELSALTGELHQACELLEKAERISSKGVANDRLQASFDDLYDAFLDVPPGERDRELAQTYADRFYGAQREIDQSRYNDEVSGFTKTRSSEFPTGLIKPLVFPGGPDTF